MKKLVLFLLSCLILTSLITFQANAQVLLDDFNRSNSSTVGGGWSEYEPGGSGSGASVSNNTLLLNSQTSGAGASNRTYVYQDVSSKYATNFSANPGTVSWYFNMQATLSQTGFNLGQRGIAYVIGSTSSDFISGGNGYAVVMGHNGGKLRLVQFTGGLGNANNITGIVSTSTTFTTQKFSVKVSYTSATNSWNLSYRIDGASFADPTTGSYTSVGNGVNSTYTNSALNYAGAFLNYDALLNTQALFDNVYIPNPLVLPSCPTLSLPANNAVSQCPTSVVLKWVAGSTGTAAASNYKVYIGTDGGGVTTPTNLVNGFSNGVVTQYTPANLANNTTYYWQIVPSNNAGSVSGCSIYSFTTSSAPVIGSISTSTNILSTCGGVTNATLTSTATLSTGTLRWQSYNGSTWTNLSSSYNNMLSIQVTPVTTTIYRATLSSSCTNAVSNTITITVPTTPSYTVTASLPYIESFSASPSCLTTDIVSGASNWTYATSFVNTVSGNSVNPYSGSYMAVFNGANGETAQLITPNFDLSSGTMTKPWFSFAWVGGKNGTGDKLNVYFSTDNGTTWGSPQLVKTAEYTWFSGQWQNEGSVDLSAYAGSNVRVMFEAVSAGGSPIAIDNIKVFNMACSTPSGLSNVGATYYSNTFSWNAMGDSAQVKYRKTGTTAWIYGPYVKTNSWFWDKLVPNTSFDWQVAVWCGNGSVPASSTVTTLSNSPAVTGMTVTNVSAGKATLSWNAVPGAVKYRVSVSADGGATWTQQVDVATTSRNYTTLTAGVNYQWRVITIYGYLYQLPIDTTNGPQFTTASCAATNLKDSVISATKAKLTWNAISGATKYWIRFSSNGGSTWTTPVSITTNSYTNVALTAGKTYTWQVAGTCDGAIMNYVNGPSFSTPASRIATIADEPETSQVNVYPNPFEKNIEVSVDSISGSMSIQIVDMMGQLVLTSTLSDLVTSIPTDNLSKGMYLIYITRDNKLIYTSKIIKN